MNEAQDPADQPLDPPANDNEANTTSDDATSNEFDPAYENRRHRIFAYRIEAQAESRTLTSCLASVNSDLLDLELEVAERLRQTLGTCPTAEDIERHGKLIDLMIRLSKQIGQFTKLELGSRKTGEEGGAPA